MEKYLFASGLVLQPNDWFYPINEGRDTSVYSRRICEATETADGCDTD